MTTANYLPEQYRRTGELGINHNYLREQFADAEPIFERLRQLVCDGDYTLGRAVDDFEARFADLVGVPHAIGVGSGTDALFLSLKALGVGPGDEVITTPYTFFATVGAIVTAGARPVFVDIREDYNLDPSRLESAITPRTRAILPVHWSGLVCEMEAIQTVAEGHGIPLVEDACHAIRATYQGRFAGSFGATGCFSMHPLKNLNVWGDGGVIVTRDPDLARRLRLMRNHGLLDRDTCEVFAYNSRLDTLQAIVAMHLMDRLDSITESRIRHAEAYDAGLAGIPQITVPIRPEGARQVYHIYVIQAEDRDGLVAHLTARGVDAKVHYPTPMHLQPAARSFGYALGDFPVAERMCRSVLSLPVHEFITEAQQAHVVDAIRSYYA